MDLSQLENLAREQSKNGDSSAALTSLSQAREAALREFGPDTLRFAQALDRIARIRDEFGDLDGAQALLEEALTVRDGAFDEGHAEVINALDRLASMSGRRRDEKRADEVLRRMLAHRIAHFGPEHPATLAVLFRTGAVYLDLGRRLSQAEHILRRTLDLRTQILGAQNPLTAATMVKLGEAWEAQGRVAEALSLYKQAYEVQERLLGPAQEQVRATAALIERARASRSTSPPPAPDETVDEPLLTAALAGAEATPAAQPAGLEVGVLLEAAEAASEMPVAAVAEAAPQPQPALVAANVVSRPRPGRKRAAKGRVTPARPTAPPVSRPNTQPLAIPVVETPIAEVEVALIPPPVVDGSVRRVPSANEKGEVAELLERVRQRLDANQATEALQALNDALEEDEVAALLNARSVVWMRLGEPMEALTDLAAACRLERDAYKPRLNRALVFLALKQETDAHRALGEAIAAAPNRVDTYLKRALMDMRRGRADAALQDLAQAIAADYLAVLLTRGHDNPSVSRELSAIRRGLTALSQGMAEEGGRAFDELIAENPQNRHANALRALAAVSGGEPESAIPMLGETGPAVRVQVLYAGVRTLALLAMGDEERARAELDRAMHGAGRVISYAYLI